MTNISPSTRTNWFCKFMETLLAAIAFFNSLTFIFEFLPSEWGEKLYQYEMIIQIAIPVVLAVIFAIIWHKKEKKGEVNSNKIHLWFRGVLRYWLAFSISVYGFAKIFQTQFQPSVIRDDSLVGSLNGFALTWNFFGYSYTLAVILGLTQIIGSILLLFRKTTLLGVVILLPVMINIVLINIFYQIAFGAFVNSVLFSVGLIFILFLRWADLKKVFLDYVDPLPQFRFRWLIYLAKIFCIVGAAALIYSYVRQETTPIKFIGKWNVDVMIKNRDTVAAGKWLTDSAAWTTVYIETGNRIYFCPNPYLYEKKKSLFMNFKLFPKKNKMSVYFMEKGKITDTTNFKLTQVTDHKMIWKGTFLKDTLEMHLSKIEKMKK